MPTYIIVQLNGKGVKMRIEKVVSIIINRLTNKEVQMKKVFIISIALIFGFALVMGCAPEEQAQTEEKPAAEAPAKTTFVTIGTGGIIDTGNSAGADGHKGHFGLSLFFNRPYTRQ